MISTIQIKAAISTLNDDDTRELRHACVFSVPQDLDNLTISCIACGMLFRADFCPPMWHSEWVTVEIMSGPRAGESWNPYLY